MEAAEEHRPLEIGTKIDAFMTAVNSSSLTALIYSQIIVVRPLTHEFFLHPKKVVPNFGIGNGNHRNFRGKSCGWWNVIIWHLIYFVCWDWCVVYVFLVVWAKGRFFPMMFIFVVVVVSLSEFWYSRLCLKESDDLLHCSLWEIVYQPVFN